MDATETDDESLIGEECHIIANSTDGPRGNISTQEDLNKYDNLILLCRIHHKIIDDQPNTYTVERLRKIKVTHEKWVRDSLQTISITTPFTISDSKYQGQKISLDFQDADIVPIFRLFADISGYNLVLDPSVRGKITIKLLNVPWDQALNVILQMFRLSKAIEGNVIWIAPANTF
ncbi:MAG: HNH endonuclease [Thermodesulfovibrionales bacterium]